MMRILVAFEYGEPYLESFRLRHPRWATLPRMEQLEALLDDYYGWPSAIARRTREKGNDVDIVILDCEPLQKEWARENGVSFGEADWPFTILQAQVERFKPDVLWMGMGLKYFGRFLATLKPHCRKLFVWIARPQPATTDLSHIDCILTSHDVFVDGFRAAGKNCEKLLPAFEPRILDRLASVSRDVTLSFVGGLSPAHHRRLACVRALIQHTPLLLWGNCLKPPPITGVRSLARRIWHHLFVETPAFKRRYQGEAWGLDLYRVMQRSRLTFNSHLEAAAAHAGNMRMFEATGCGSALLTENFSNLSRLFEPGREVIAYDDEDDLIQKVKYYLEHEEEATAIGIQGQQRTLRDHNTITRADEFLDICRSCLEGAK